jgi:hypothetical protein
MTSHSELFARFVSSLSEGDSSLALAYFFFDFNDKRKQLVRSLICCLITSSPSCALAFL